MLNEIPEIFAAGELGYTRIFTNTNRCFCAKTYASCPVWGNVKKDTRLRNFFIEIMFSQKTGRYLRIHYEELIENPGKEIKRIQHMLGLTPNPLSFIEGNRIKLGICHLSAGNIGLLGKEEEVVLKQDERWKHEMKWWNVLIVTMMTWPLLLKYFILDKMMKKKHV
jgi:hypothetical protein